MRDSDALDWGLLRMIMLAAVDYLLIISESLAVVNMHPIISNNMDGAWRRET